MIPVGPTLPLASWRWRAPPRVARAIAVALVAPFVRLRAPLFAAALATGASLLALASTASAQVGRAQGWLGVALARSSAKGKPGALVTHVIRGSPAEKAGVREGDRIVKLDGAPVAAPPDVTSPVALKGAGRVVKLDVARAAPPHAVTAIEVKLGPRPSPDDVFRMESVGAKVTLPPLKLATGPGPVAYPALQGRVVVVDLFATWCGPCLLLGPHYDALHAKYAAQGLTILAISSEDTSVLAEWGAKHSVRYTLASDPSDTALSSFGAQSLPSSLIVDKHGVVRDVTVGFDVAQVKRTEQLVQALLKEP